MTQEQHNRQLAARWRALYQGAGQAIDWIGQVRGNAPRLNNEADNLILKLLRTRNLASNLGRTVLKPVTVGFFGLSQAGKSYLISALAAGDNGKLETRLGGRQLDFIEHINPPGGGKEATGLVTRFTRSAAVKSPDFPVELCIFSEIDLVKILANAYLKDFDQEKVHCEIREERISQLLGDLARKQQDQTTASVTMEDMVALMDYLTRHAEATQRRLSLCYWKDAVPLATKLNIEERARLFSVLWGEIPELTQVFCNLARSLERLGGAQRVCAPLSVLVRESDNGLSQADSIMNVDILDRLNREQDDRISVRPWHNDQLHDEVDISLSELAALTAELVFPLAEPPRVALFEHVDLLDFPGYRGRLNVESLDAITPSANNPRANPVAQLILRGKVAYLFERYTDNQEMNVLVFCTASDKQSDVPNVDAVLSEWIRKTQGETPEVRQRRQPGLLWAITRMDLRIQGSMQQNEGILTQAWGDMMKLTMLERFDSCDWLHQWGTETPFNNTFLVRKPRTGASFIEEKDGQETAIRPDYQDKLALMRSTFATTPDVQRFVRTPEQAWDAMLQIDEGGMSRMGAYLAEVALPEIKLQRIEEQLQEILRDLVDHRLSNLYQADSSGELQKKRIIAGQVVKALSGRAGIFGELLHYLQLPTETLLSLYLREQEEQSEIQEIESNTSSAALQLADDPFGMSQGFSLYDEDNNTANSQNASAFPYEARFAEQVMREWTGHLRNLPEDQRKLNFMALPKEILESLVDELIIAANRVRLKETLTKRLSGAEQAGVRRDQLAQRQVIRARTTLSDFTCWLDFDTETDAKRPDSKVNPGHKLFELPSAITPGQLPHLPETPTLFSRYFLGDWFVGFGKLTEENVGHSAGREITTEQNEQLGHILENIRRPAAE